MTIRQVRGPTPLAWSPDGRWAVGAGRAVQLWHADPGVVRLDDIGVATSVREVLLLSGSVRAPSAANGVRANGGRIVRSVAIVRFGGPRFVASPGDTGSRRG